MERFSVEDKLKEIDREIMQRHRVYPRLISRGVMTKETATRQIAMLNAVAEDYRAKVKEGPLFAFARGSEPPALPAGSILKGD